MKKISLSYYYKWCWNQRHIFLFLFYIIILNSILNNSFTQTLSYEHILNVGTGLGYPPYQFLRNGEITGFDIDLVRALAEVMGYTVRIKPHNLSSIQEDLKNGKFDIWAGISYSPERQGKFLFSEPICTISYGIFVKKGSGIVSHYNLTNRILAVLSGSSMALELVKYTNFINLIYVQEDLSSLVLLNSLQCDAAALAKMTGLFYIHEMNLNKIDPVEKEIVTREQCLALDISNK